MGFTTTIQATLGLGVGKFMSGLRQAGDGVNTFGKQARQKFLNWFSAGSVLAGFAAAINKAQELREEAYKTGQALDPAVQRTAELADTLERAKGYALEMVAGILSFTQAVVDGAVARLGAAMGMGTYQENMDAITQGRKDDETKGRQKATTDDREKKLKEEQEATKALGAAELQVHEARLEQARVQASIEQQVVEAKKDVADAELDVTAFKEGTIDRAKAELALIERQNELLDLQKKREDELSEAKAKQAETEKQAAAARQAAQDRLNKAIAEEMDARQRVEKARTAYQVALSDQSAASLDEVNAGTRGSREDQRRAAEVERLRTRARSARDAGALSVVGGQAVAVADQLSTRANQVQSTIGSLNSAERDPLAAVEAQLVEANQSLAEMNESLRIMELEG